LVHACAVAATAALVNAKMRILLLSFYFRPDLSAGSFRAAALVSALLKADPNLEIEVITTLPNRYSSFSPDAPEVEEHDRLQINRIALPGHKGGMLDQALAFLRFAARARSLTRGKRYDLVYATSSRLMTAALGAHLARRMRAPLYLDIRDIFSDTIGDVLPRIAPVSKPVFEWLERRTIAAAASVNLVSEGFREHFEARNPATRLTFFTNGIDDEFLNLDLPELKATDPLVILYAGNVGEGQGLHRIVPAIARRLGSRVVVRIIGGGGRLELLARAVAEAGVDNVELAPPVGRQELISEYARADVLLLHLNDYPAFRKVLPSKLFEYAATGRPVLAGIAGHSAEFAEANVENCAVFPPCDDAAAEAALARLTLVSTERAGFKKKFARRVIMGHLAADILAQAKVSAR
jgi:glycosyltransferase involved in cell wall biosynthesis